MKKILLLFLPLALSTQIFAQQFSQINTGTLYDSFEHPAQRAFIPDSSRTYAFNFLFPNFDANFYLTGDAQTALKTRIFSDYYNTAALQIGQGKLNHVDVNTSAYSLMFKLFANLDGSQEAGFYLNTKAEARGVITDESVAFFNGSGSFPNTTYNNIFNDSYYYQIYNQIGFTYREQIDKKFALGFKIGLLSGINYQNLQINSSTVTFDKESNSATAGIQGVNYESGTQPIKLGWQDIIPNFRNPGAAISIGTSYKTDEGFILQANIKDLGFIHWNTDATISNFNASATVHGLSSPHREDSVYNKLNYLSGTNPVRSSFNSPTNGLLELSINKSFPLDDEHIAKFSPTLIASKELEHNGFTAALVTPVQYQQYAFSLTPSINELLLFNLGAQFMIKSPNAEFFIGSERLLPTGSVAHSFISNTPGSATNGAFTGADFFIGFSIKFGPVIEHPMNASHVPLEPEKGFLGRIFDSIFPKPPLKNN